MTAQPPSARPLLLGMYHVTPLAPDRVQVGNAGRSIVLSGQRITERLTPLLRALDGRHTVDELTRRFPGLVPDALEALGEKGFLVDGAGGEDDSSITARLTATALSCASSPADLATSFAAATMVLSGCGPVGGMVAVGLAKAGIGRLLLADPQPTSSRDISLSCVLPLASEGQPRTEVVGALCKEVGATLAQPVPRPLPPDALREVDLALIEVGYEANGRVSPDADTCLSSGTTYLPYTQDGLDVVIGPMVLAGTGPCHRCLESRRQSHLAHLAEDLAYHQSRSQTAPRADTFLAAHNSIVAGVLATECLAFLVSEPRTRGAVLVIDLAGMTMVHEALPRVPDCLGCDPAKRGFT